MDEKKSFWATVPGILTGIAAVIGAITTLYIALHSAPNMTPPPGGSPPSKAHPTSWQLIAEDTFTKESSNWSIGSFPKKETPRFELRMVDGRYRWDISFNRSWRTGRVYSPYGAVVNFKASIDVKFVDETNITTATIHIGETGDQIYSFNVSSNGKYSLTKVNPSAEKLEVDLIGWTLISFKSGDKYKSNAWNRMMIVAEDQLLRLYVNSELQGEYRDITFKGGKIGLSVNMYEKGSAVVDFDNFELLRKS